MSITAFAFLVYLFIAYEAAVFIGVTIWIAREGMRAPENEVIELEGRDEIRRVLLYTGLFLALLVIVFFVGS